MISVKFIKQEIVPIKRLVDKDRLVNDVGSRFLII